MSQLRELEITITRSKASFEVGNKPYQGKHRLNKATLAGLRALYNDGGGNPVEYGAMLFGALFVGTLEEGYRAARQEVRAARARWRLRLNIDLDATELHGLWWEALYDPDPPPQSLGRWMDTPLSRYLGTEANVPVETDTVKVLAVVSNPIDLGQGVWERYPSLDDTAERAVISEAVKDLPAPVEVRVEPMPATYAGIRELLRTENFNVLHLVGHGQVTPDGKRSFFLLEKEDRTARPVEGTTLGGLVSNLPCLKLVVLAACHSAKRSDVDAFRGLAPQMILYGVPAVVAMQQQVAEKTARAFTKRFYQALGATGDTGGMVDAAMNWARDLLYADFEETPGWDWAIPVLFMQGDGKLFELGTGAGAVAGDSAAGGAASAAATAVERPVALPVEPQASKVETELAAPAAFPSGGRLDPYGTLMLILNDEDRDAICDLLWSIPFAEFPGATIDAKVRALIKRCREEGRLDQLQTRLEIQQHVASRRARELEAREEAEALKVVDLARFRTRGIAL